MVLTHNHSIGTNWIFAHWLIMVRSRNWPDLWWQISKIRDIQVVGVYDLMKRWRFETNRISSVATAQPQSQKPVFDFDLTWWRDLWWPGAEIFTQGVKFNCEQVLKNGGAARRRVSPIREKPEGWAFFAPPPVRVLICFLSLKYFASYWWNVPRTDLVFTRLFPNVVSCLTFP